VIALHTRNHIPHKAIIHWKATLQALNRALSRESRELLLFLYVTRQKGIWYSGDALLRFAGLIAAGLVEITSTVHGEGITERRDSENFFGGRSEQILEQTPPTKSVSVELSERGLHLVKAWLEGEISNELCDPA